MNPRHTDPLPRIFRILSAVLCFMAFSSSGNAQYYGGPAPGTPAGNPNSRPAAASTPTTRPMEPIVQGDDGNPRRVLPKPPFEQTEAEWKATQAVLVSWERFSTNVRTFRSVFTRYRYVISFNDPNKMDCFQESGELRYESPDKGMFLINDSAGKSVEKWQCDGKSIYEYKFNQNQIEQHTLPEKLRGKAITAGPLPFLFGATAAELRKRYHLRLVAPPEGKQKEGQVWLEAFPKTAEDATDFQRAEMIVSLKPEVRPVAIRLHKVNNELHSYLFNFNEMEVNKAQFLPASWGPTTGERMKMQLIMAEK